MFLYRSQKPHKNANKPCIALSNQHIRIPATHTQPLSAIYSKGIIYIKILYISLFVASVVDFVLDELGDGLSREEQEGNGKGYAQQGVAKVELYNVNSEHRGAHYGEKGVEG